MNSKLTNGVQEQSSPIVYRIEQIKFNSKFQLYNNYVGGIEWCPVSDANRESH